MGVETVIAGAALSGIAGALGDKKSGSSTETSSVNLRDINELNQGRSALEATGVDAQTDYFKQAGQMVAAGPGMADIQASQQAYNSLSQILGQGPVPSQGMLDVAGRFAQQAFAPEQVAMQQQFRQQGVESNRLAARLGRSANDPILRAKLAQQQADQSAQLQARQGAFATQYAMQLPEQQISMAERLAQVRGGLATQALANRQAMFGMGQQLTQQERNYRLQAAGRTTSGSQTETSGGGLGGAISGGFAGLGSMLTAGSNLGWFKK